MWATSNTTMNVSMSHTVGKLTAAVAVLALIAAACSDSPSPTADPREASTAGPTSEPAAPEPTTTTGQSRLPPVLTTSDDLPELTIRIGDQRWQVTGGASSFCGPDECFDAGFSIDVSQPIIVWDTSQELTIEAPLDVTRIQAAAREVDTAGNWRPLRLLEAPDRTRTWIVDSRPPSVPMAISVTIDIEQDRPTAVTASIGYGAELRPAEPTPLEDLPSVLDAAARANIDARACDAGPDSALDLSDEPPGRSFQSREWTDQNGCLVRVDVVTGYFGAEHCGWQTTEVLITGSPLLDRFTSPKDRLAYIRDPEGAYGDQALVDGFDPDAVLPTDASPTPFFSRAAGLWIGPDAAYLVDGFAVERWPLAPRVLLCD
jgi:hypothetical protein